MSGIDEALARGNNAELLLNNPTLNEAFESMLTEEYAEWLASPPKDAAGREGLYQQAQAIAKLRTKLATWMGDAVKEKDDLQREEARRARLVRRTPKPKGDK